MPWASVMVTPAGRVAAGEDDGVDVRRLRSSRCGGVERGRPDTAGLVDRRCSRRSPTPFAIIGLAWPAGSAGTTVPGRGARIVPPAGRRTGACGERDENGRNPDRQAKSLHRHASPRGGVGAVTVARAEVMAPCCQAIACGQVVTGEVDVAGGVRAGGRRCRRSATASRPRILRSTSCPAQFDRERRLDLLRRTRRRGSWCLGQRLVRTGPLGLSAPYVFALRAGVVVADHRAAGRPWNPVDGYHVLPGRDCCW